MLTFPVSMRERNSSLIRYLILNFIIIIFYFFRHSLPHYLENCPLFYIRRRARKKYGDSTSSISSTPSDDDDDDKDGDDDDNDDDEWGSEETKDLPKEEK